MYWQQDAGAPVAPVNAWGEPEAWTLGSGTDVTRLHDPATGLLTNVSAGPNHSGALVNLSYGYDALGNVNAASDAIESVSQTLGYDGLNRLTSWTVYNPNVPGGMGRGAGYDAGGNLQWRTLVGNYDYGENGAPPHAVTTITHQGDLNHYGYDGAGRMNAGAGYASVSRDPYGEPTELQANAGGNPPSLWLSYDTDGALLTKTVYGSAEWRYFGKLFVQTGSSYRERIIANGEVVAIVNVSAAGFPSVDYRVSDNLGSTAAIVNASGELEGRYAWDAWGDLVNPASGNGDDPSAEADEALTTLGYTGHEMFWEAGLVHTQARLYAPAIGRWLSPDPTVPDLGDGQSLNRYSYVLNNPMTYTDPNGYFAWATFRYALAEYAWGGLEIAGYALADAATGGGATPFLIPGFLETSDTLTNAIQNTVAAVNNKGPVQSPLSTLISEAGNEGIEWGLTAVEMVADPKKMVSKLAFAEAQAVSLHWLQGSAEQSAASGRGDRVGAGAGGAASGGWGFAPWMSPSFQIAPSFKFVSPMAVCAGYVAWGCEGSAYSGHGLFVEVFNDGTIRAWRGGQGDQTVSFNPDGSVTYALPGGGSITIGNFAGGSIYDGLEAATRWE